jgi:hypothetical protein
MWSRRCACEEGAMTVRYVLLRCPTWRVIREEELADFRGDIRRILNTSPGATAAIRLILRNGPIQDNNMRIAGREQEKRG